MTSTFGRISTGSVIIKGYDPGIDNYEYVNAYDSLEIVRPNSNFTEKHEGKLEKTEDNA
jgi:hypothetical protein